MRHLVLHNLKLCEISGAVALSVQVFTLVLSCSVMASERAERRLEYDALDEYNLETASTRSSTRAAPSRGAAGSSSRVERGNEAWTRINSKYGIEEGPAFDPEQARLAAGADENVAEASQRGKCSVM